MTNKQNIIGGKIDTILLVRFGEGIFGLLANDPVRP